MYKVYRISEAQLAAAAMRTIRTAVKLMVIVFVFLNLYLFWQVQLTIKLMLIGATVYIPGNIIALTIGYALVKQKYRTYRIVLDDNGVEFYIRGNDKKINWNNLQSVTKPDGTIELHDKHVSTFFRVMTGEGSIQLIPEIERFDELRAEINKFKTFI
jgi:hypothetical protein